MAASIGDPAGAGRIGGQIAQGVRGQIGVTGSEHRPNLHHEAVVIGQITDRTREGTRAQVWRKVSRPDDRLGFEKHCGAYDSGDRAQH